MKRSIDDLAIFGGGPAFLEPKPIGQLHAPDIERFLALVEVAYAGGDLIDGPNCITLEQRLAAFHDVRCCVAVANAGHGLMLLLRLLAGGRRGRVVMPGFSFRGLPHFARWAGLEPTYCDVEPGPMTLCPRALDAAVDRDTVAVLAVCNPNSPGDVSGLCEVAGRHGVPILFDSVYAAGATHLGAPMGRWGAAEVFSLHATKLLNGFEGGYVTTNDLRLADALRRLRGSEPASGPVPGLEARMNELHAAMALCSLDDVDAIIAGNRQRYQAYQAACEPIVGLGLVHYEDEPGEARNYEMCILDVSDDLGLSRDRLAAVLRAEGCAINQYYSPPLYRSAPATGQPEGFALPVTESLAKRLLQLPVGELVSLADVAAIGQLLHFTALNARTIASRLMSGGR